MRFSVISRRSFFEFPYFCASCNVISALFLVTDTVYFYVVNLRLYICSRKRKINKHKILGGNILKCTLMFSFIHNSGSVQQWKDSIKRRTA